MVLRKGKRKGETVEVAPSPAKKRPKSQGESSQNVENSGRLELLM